MLRPRHTWRSFVIIKYRDRARSVDNADDLVPRVKPVDGHANKTGPFARQLEDDKLGAIPHKEDHTVSRRITCGEHLRDGVGLRIQHMCRVCPFGIGQNNAVFMSFERLGDDSAHHRVVFSCQNYSTDCWRMIQVLRHPYPPVDQTSLVRT